jgi:tRNA dimethylallyltransferase
VRFAAAEFKTYANEKIADIRHRGKVPLLVGGTGLYVDAVIYDYAFPTGTADSSIREQYESMTLEELHEYCDKNNIKLPENYKNKRYVINAILRGNSLATRRKQPIENCIIVGITTDKDLLRTRIEGRAEEIFTVDVIQEASQLASAYGWDSEAMTGNIYPLIRQYLAGKLSLEEAKDKFKTLDWRLAKRQLTWLRRHEHIRWLSLEDAYTYCARELAQSNKS